MASDLMLQARRRRLAEVASLPEVLAVLNIDAPTETEQIRCPNPAHDDQRPSARYYEPHGSTPGGVHCFKCGRQWDAVGLAAVVLGVPAADAIEWLESAFGLAEDSEATSVRGLVRYRQSHPNVEALRALTADAIRAHRAALTFEQYARAWAAKDVADFTYETSGQTVSFLKALAAIRAFVDVSSTHAHHRA